MPILQNCLENVFILANFYFIFNFIVHYRSEKLQLEQSNPEKNERKRKKGKG